MGTLQCFLLYIVCMVSSVKLAEFIFGGNSLEQGVVVQADILQAELLGSGRSGRRCTSGCSSPLFLAAVLGTCSGGSYTHSADEAVEPQSLCQVVVVKLI